MYSLLTSPSMFFFHHYKNVGRPGSICFCQASRTILYIATVTYKWILHPSLRAKPCPDHTSKYLVTQLIIHGHLILLSCSMPQPKLAVKEWPQAVFWASSVLSSKHIIIKKQASLTVFVVDLYTIDIYILTTTCSCRNQLISIRDKQYSINKVFGTWKNPGLSWRFQLYILVTATRSTAGICSNLPHWRPFPLSLVS